MHLTLGGPIFPRGLQGISQGLGTPFRFSGLACWSVAPCSPLTLPYWPVNCLRNLCLGHLWSLLRSLICRVGLIRDPRHRACVQQGPRHAGHPTFLHPERSGRKLGQGPFEGSRQTPVWAAVLPWAGRLTSLSLCPHGSSRGMLEPSLLQRVASAGRGDVYTVLRCVRSQAVMAAHGRHPQRVAVGFRRCISSPMSRTPPLEPALPAQVPSSDREPPS